MPAALRQGLIGATLGALLTLGGIALAPDAPPAVDPTTTTSSPDSTEPPRAVWNDQHETLMGPATIVLERLELDGTQAVLTYRVDPITPSRNGFSFSDDGGPPVAPEVFVLETRGGDVPASATRARSTQVRFDVPDGFSLDDVSGVRLERYWMRLPYRYDLDLPATVGTVISLDEHIRLSVDAVVPQSDTTLVNLGTTHLSDEFIAGLGTEVWATGREPGWTSGFRQTGAGIGGASGVQLTFTGSVMPDPIPLQINSPQWLPYEATIRLDIAGMLRG